MNRLRSRLLGLLVIVCGGCSSTAETEPPRGATSAAPIASVAPRSSYLHKSGLARKTQRLRGADEVRVTLVVLPADALVEVDGQPVRRRHGLIELVGKVGEKRQVRVFSGAMATEEKVVKIQSDGPLPAKIDADTMTLVKVEVIKKTPARVGRGDFHK